MQSEPNEIPPPSAADARGGLPLPELVEVDSRGLRLHPASLLFSIGDVLRRFLIPGLIVIFARRGEDVEMWLMVLAVPAAIYAVVRFLTLRYRFGPAELIVREGILNRNERHIPYARIQNIDTVQTLVHRVLGVADVVIHTASGGTPEATLRVLSLKAVDAMRGRVFAGRGDVLPVLPADAALEPAAAPAVPEAGGALAPPASLAYARMGHVIAHLGLGELTLVGIISNRGMVAAAAIFGLCWQYGWNPAKSRVVRQLGGASWLHPRDTATMIVIGVVALLGIIILLRLLSIALAIITHYDFTLTRDGDELRVQYGLFTRHSLTIPRHRIQVLHLEAGLLSRLFNRVSVRAETAGGLTPGEAGSARRALVPLLRTSDVPMLLAEVQPEIRIDDADWQRMDPRARGRLVRRNLIIATLIAVPIAVRFGGWTWVAAGVLLAWAAASALVQFSCSRHALTDAAIMVRNGWLSRTTSAVRYSKVQTVALTISPFDRRWRMAGVRFDTAGSPLVTRSLAIAYLPVSGADAVYSRLVSETAGTEFRW